MNHEHWKRKRIKANLWKHSDAKLKGLLHTVQCQPAAVFSEHTPPNGMSVSFYRFPIL